MKMVYIRKATLLIAGLMCMGSLSVKGASNEFTTGLKWVAGAGMVVVAGAYAHQYHVEQYAHTVERDALTITGKSGKGDFFRQQITFYDSLGVSCKTLGLGFACFCLGADARMSIKSKKTRDILFDAATLATLGVYNLYSILRPSSPADFARIGIKERPKESNIPTPVARTISDFARSKLAQDARDVVAWDKVKSALGVLFFGAGWLTAKIRAW